MSLQCLIFGVPFVLDVWTRHRYRSSVPCHTLSASIYGLSSHPFSSGVIGEEWSGVDGREAWLFLMMYSVRGLSHELLTSGVHKLSFFSVFLFSIQLEGLHSPGPIMDACTRFAAHGGLGEDPYLNGQDLELSGVQEETITLILVLRFAQKPERMAWRVQLELFGLVQRWLKANHDIPRSVGAALVRLFFNLDTVPMDMLRVHHVLESDLVSLELAQTIRLVKDVSDNFSEQTYEAKSTWASPDNPGSIVVHHFNPEIKYRIMVAQIDLGRQCVWLKGESREKPLIIGPSKVGASILISPVDIAFNHDGILFVFDKVCSAGPEFPDVYAGVIHVFETPSGDHLRQFRAGWGVPRGLDICPVTRHVVVGTDRGKVSFLTQEGVPIHERSLIMAHARPIGDKIGIAITPLGTIVVSSTLGLQSFESNGLPTGIVFPGSRHRASWYLSVSRAGDVLIPLVDQSDTRCQSICVFSPMGRVLQFIGVGGDSPVEEVDGMCGLAVDPHGILWISHPGDNFTLRTEGEPPFMHYRGHTGPLCDVRRIFGVPRGPHRKRGIDLV